mgnify:CR=1 FL=1
MFINFKNTKLIIKFKVITTSKYIIISFTFYIIKYIKKLSKLKEPTDDVILKHMEKLIYAINKLNRKADLCLLESEIGDDVCFFIEDVAFEAGFPETDEDITYDWREEW